MSASEDLINVHHTQGTIGKEPKDKNRRFCLELIDSWLWIDEVPEVSFDCLVMTSIDSGDPGVILFTNERAIVCHVDARTGSAWQQTASRASSKRIERRRKPVAAVWNVYEAGVSVPGSKAVAVESNECAEFEVALKKGSTK